NSCQKVVSTNGNVVESATCGTLKRYTFYKRLAAQAILNPTNNTQRSSTIKKNACTRYADYLILRSIEPLFHWKRSNLQKDRKSTRLNSSHVKISYAVFCLKKNRSSQHTSELLS